MADDIKLGLEAYDNEDYQKAFDYFTKARKIYGKENENSYSFKYIKCIYSTKLKSITTISKEEQDLIKYCLKRLKTKDLFHHLIIFKIVGILEKKFPYPGEKIIIWLSKLDPEHLSKDRSEYKGKDGKIILNQSHREKYYSILSKTYEKIENFEKSAQISKEALENLSEFTNDSDIWFTRRIAHFEKSKGNFDKALVLLEEIKKKKHDWFILSDLGDVYMKKGDINKAKSYYLEAALSPGDYTMMTNLFKKIATIYSKENPDFFKDNVLLYLKIRNEKKWKIKEEGIKFLEKLNINIDDIEDSKKLYFKLKKQYQKMRWDSEERYSGVITRLLEKAGFINTDNNKKYYFRFRSFEKRKENLKIGMKVSFNSIEGFDKKRQEVSWEAINIRTEI